MYTEALITQHCRSYLKIMKNNKSDCLGCDATSKERFYITLLQVLSSTIVAQLIILTCIFVNAFLLLILHTLNKKFLPILGISNPVVASCWSSKMYKYANLIIRWAGGTSKVSCSRVPSGPGTKANFDVSVHFWHFIL